MNIKIFMRLLKISVMETISLRTTSIIMFFIVNLFFILQILSGYVFFEYTDTLGGLTRIEYFNLIVTGNIIIPLSYSVFLKGQEKIYFGVLSGELDYDLIRPTNSFWYYTFNGIDLQSLITAILYIFLQIYLFTFQNLTITGILLYTLMLFIGAWYIFLVNRLLVILVFYFEKANSIMAYTEELDDMGSKPIKIYPKAIRYVFIYGLSYLMVYNAPINILKGEVNSSYMIAYMLSTVILSFVVYKLWFKAVKKYQSAN
ncbi:ABC-2 family transporter protein [Oceanivirga salmonicida]|uniref:ABC-2 family transporter protein n=1 Tax=Oceanivirga salmonicida TaxID=1769291 RepID=UPI000835C302|nr:ABC-2 family transporter protein [Oceanivirga salmonicida]